MRTEREIKRKKIFEDRAKTCHVVKNKVLQKNLTNLPHIVEGVAKK